MARHDPEQSRWQAVIADATPLLVEALAKALGEAGVAVAARVADTEAALAAITEHCADLAIIGDITVLRAVRSAALSTRIILFAAADPGPLAEAVDLGVDGLVLRSSPVAALEECLAAVAAGRQWLDSQALAIGLDHRAAALGTMVPALTRRERDVARLVATGQRNRVIATALGISEGTVKMHLHNVYAKLGLESRTQLAVDMRSRT